MTTPAPLCPPISPSQSHSSGSTTGSVDNLLDQSFLLSGPDCEWPQAAPRTVTKLVPYRLKRIQPEEEAAPPPQRFSRDEKAARQLNIPYSVNFLINCGMEEFTDLINGKTLSNEQMNLCRDIRKRGKNKVRRQFLTILPKVRCIGTDCGAELSEEKD